MGLTAGHGIAALTVGKVQTLVSVLLEKWAWVLFILLLGHLSRSIKSYFVFRPEKTIISGLPTFVGQWISSLSYHVVAKDVVHNAYRKVWSEPGKAILELL